MTSRRKISGRFAPRMIEMLGSPAMRALSLSGRRVLDRIEIELAEHGGNDNGKLSVTHKDFEQFGINRNSIGAGIREALALGFIKQTQRGFASAGHHSPSLFEITYRPVGQAEPTNDWQRITSIEEAETIAAEARERNRNPNFPPPLNNKATPIKRGWHDPHKPRDQQPQNPTPINHGTFLEALHLPAGAPAAGAAAAAGGEAAEPERVPGPDRDPERPPKTTNGSSRGAADVLPLELKSLRCRRRGRR